jgi:hypothetical protein
MTIYNMHTFDCAWLLSDPGSAAAQRNMRITTANGPVIESITYFSASGLGRSQFSQRCAGRIWPAAGERDF